MKIIELIVLFIVISAITSHDIPEIKIILYTSNSYCSGTNDQFKITFRNYICSVERSSPDFKVYIMEIPLILNPNKNEIKTGSINTYSFKDSRFKDIS
jgi:hypothetical protein